MPYKVSCVQSISFITRFDFHKYSSPVSSVKKVKKKGQIVMNFTEAYFQSN